MSVTVGNIFQGAATIEFAPYVAPAAGAEPTGHSFTDAGATFDPVQIDDKRTYHDIDPEQYLAPIGTVKIGSDLSIKCRVGEATLANYRIAMDQATGNVTGSPPNASFVDRPGDPAQYLCVRVKGVSGGTTALRTHTFWRCVVTDESDYKHAKKERQWWNLVIHPFQDSAITVAATGQRSKVVDS